ncbi:MAG: PEGA domain-containing protein [Burkholderiales bacterium]
MSAKKLGRFEIVSELGQADPLSVYLAKDPREGRTVVLRTMRLDPNDPELAARAIRFSEEAARVCTLDSPNIAKFYEHGETDGCFFLVSEHVIGESLRKQIDQNKDFTLDDIQDLTRQACSAFDHAHSRDVAASSLKPSRFVIESDGTLKILDFGLTETIGADRKSALHYRSPEEYAGEKPDLRSNLFSWGAVLYEVVTGQKAFPGFDEESIRECVLESMPPTPEELLPGMPAGVSAVIVKALKKNLVDRYVRGSELVRSLEEYKNYKAPEETELPFMLQQHVRAGAGAIPARPLPDSKPSPRIAAATMAPAKPVPSPPVQAPEPVSPVSAILPTPAVAALPARLPATKRPATVVERPPVDAVLSEYAPPKPGEAAQKPKTTSQALAQMHSWATQSDREESRLAIDPAGPAMPPRMGSPKIQMSSRTRMLVYASAAVLVALTALFSTGSRFRKVSASPPQVAPVSPVSTDPAFSEPFAPKQAAQLIPPKQGIAFEIDDTPPKIKHFKPKQAAPAKVVPAPAPVTGDLAVTTSPPGARVQVDGRGDVEWISPCVVTGLTAGQHVLTISKPGFVVSTRSIDVIAGGRADVSVPMAVLGASLAIASNPAGATILVDGKDTGRVTPAQVVVPHGRHTIAVQKPGYLDASTSAEFTPGQVFKFEPALQAMGNVDRMRSTGKGFGKLFGKVPEGMGRVQFRTDPRSAQITLNNRVLDRDTPAEVFLEPGSYQVVLSLPGYKPIQKVINVENGGKVVIDETLQR